MLSTDGLHNFISLEGLQWYICQLFNLNAFVIYFNFWEEFFQYAFFQQMYKVESGIRHQH